MKKFETNPNQKKILIQKETCNKNNKYTTINLDALCQAMKDLTNAQFKVWIYLAKNADEYELNLSPAEGLYWGIKKTTMQETIREFIKKGYLVADPIKKNYYYFNEIPVYVDK